jgi:hypothetical protein
MYLNITKLNIIKPLLLIYLFKNIIGQNRIVIKPQNTLEIQMQVMNFVVQ